MKVSNKPLSITCSYIPPNGDISPDKKHAAFISDRAETLKSTDMGDFKLPTVTCYSDNPLQYLIEPTDFSTNYCYTEHQGFVVCFIRLYASETDFIHFLPTA